MTAAAKTTTDGLAAVQLLVDKGANVNLKNKDGDTALHLAAEQGKTEVVLLLLNSGAEVDPSNTDEYTPLQLCASTGHLECGLTLVQFGASVHARNAVRWRVLALTRPLLSTHSSLSLAHLSPLQPSAAICTVCTFAAALDSQLLGSVIGCGSVC
jgi:ankyrin repeat protein